jgi:hypothetical protein
MLDSSAALTATNTPPFPRVPSLALRKRRKKNRMLYKLSSIMSRMSPLSNANRHPRAINLLLSEAQSEREAPHQEPEKLQKPAGQTDRGEPWYPDRHLSLTIFAVPAERFPLNQSEAIRTECP